jgi:hypothetical protein
VKIPLPPALEEVAKGMRMFGRGKDADDLVTAMNQAAEQAVPAAPLAVKFLPVVKRATDRAGLAQKYNQLAGEGAKIGLVRGDSATVEQYVTSKALYGLYLMIREEERVIRQNPAAAGSGIVAKVFGVLRIGHALAFMQ